MSILSIFDVEDKSMLDFNYWHYGITGLPFWIQYPEIPRCPVSGRLMRFVCHLNSCLSIKIVQSTLSFTTKYAKDYCYDLRFWGSGTLYIFMEPETKIVGFLIQDT